MACLTHPYPQTSVRASEAPPALPLAVPHE